MLLHKLYIGAIAAIVLTAGFFGARYEIQIARAEEAQKSADKVIAAKDQALRDLKQQKLESDIRWAQAIADVKTGKQGIQILQPIISPQGQPAPQTITKGDLNPEAQKNITGPLSENLHLLTDDQVINAAKRELKCEQTESDLRNCEKANQALQEENDSLKKTNTDWKNAGSVGPWMAAAGFSRNAAGNGYSPNLFIQRRITSNWGIMAGVQGKGDLSLTLTRNFGGKN